MIRCGAVKGLMMPTSYIDRFVLGEKILRKQIQLQVTARFNPNRINIPKGWRPKTEFDRHLLKLMNCARR